MFQRLMKIEVRKKRKIKAHFQEKSIICTLFVEAHVQGLTKIEVINFSL